MFYLDSVIGDVNVRAWVVPWEASECWPKRRYW
jgi:hypothetical protein